MCARTVFLVAAFGSVITTHSLAGPCTEAIDRMQSEVDTRIASIAGTGPSARESAAATMHRQPTPESMVEEERKLGEGAKMQAALAALARARIADGVNNKTSCELALAE